MKIINLRKNNIFKKTGLSRGFTLLEALVAVSILMVAVTAPITIAQKGLSSAVYTKNQMIASYLAQDAIEYIKNKRDNNVLAEPKRNWLDGLVDFCFISLEELNRNENLDRVCKIDTVINAGAGEILSENYTNPAYLKKKDDFYGYDIAGTPTNFTRKIQIIEKEAGVSALIKVIVGWNNDEDNKVEVNTIIYNF